MIRCMLLLMLLLHSLPLPGTPLPMLVVTLRDADNHGIAGVQVSVRAVASDARLATTTTDAAGVALLPLALPRGTPVRVAVEGQLSDGAPVTHMGTDADGIRVFLDTAVVTLALRVDATGQVVIDPTQLARESAGLVGTAVPTAAATDSQVVIDPSHLAREPAGVVGTAVPSIATAVPSASATTTTTAPRGVAHDTAVRESEPRRALLVILGLLLVCGVLALVRMRQKLRGL